MKFEITNMDTARDTYLTKDNCVNRLVAEYKKYGKLIVAYDFDDTVYGTGETHEQLIELIRACKEAGCYLIVFTCRTVEDYDIVEDYLNGNDIPYDIINESCPDVELPTSRKIFYNIFLDDRAGLTSAYEILVRTLDAIRKER